MNASSPDRPSPRTESRPQIMGILNLTPDSFSDGGRYVDAAVACEHAWRMITDGADVIDIGGESTRPGSQRVDADEQIARIVPTIKRLRATIDQRKLPTILSVDTTLGQVAEAALDAGATMLNDVSGSTDARSAPTMIALAARKQIPIAMMHMLGEPATMQQDPRYENVVRQVRDFLVRQANVALDAGLSREQIYLDPGIGFGKSKAHNLELLAHLNELVVIGFPVLLGTSRKRFMGTICQITEDPSQPPRVPLPHELVAATCATTSLGVMLGVKMFRVHDVRENRHAADLAWAIKSARHSAT